MGVEMSVEDAHGRNKSILKKLRHLLVYSI